VAVAVATSKVEQVRGCRTHLDRAGGVRAPRGAADWRRCSGRRQALVGACERPPWPGKARTTRPEVGL
jgi:hypothetical protein